MAHKETKALCVVQKLLRFYQCIPMCQETLLSFMKITNSLESLLPHLAEESNLHLIVNNIIAFASPRSLTRLVRSFGPFASNTEKKRVLVKTGSRGEFNFLCSCYEKILLQIQYCVSQSDCISSRLCCKVFDITKNGLPGTNRPVDLQDAVKQCEQHIIHMTKSLHTFKGLFRMFLLHLINFHRRHNYSSVVGMKIDVRMEYKKGMMGAMRLPISFLGKSISSMQTEAVEDSDKTSPEIEDNNSLGLPVQTQMDLKLPEFPLLPSLDNKNSCDNEHPSNGIVFLFSESDTSLDSLF